MSKLNELISELCPDGVEYVSIGDVVKYEQPTKYIVKNTTMIFLRQYSQLDNPLYWDIQVKQKEYTMHQKIIL